jgi:predicted NBD/HSP70 family sugar kinase
MIDPSGPDPVYVVADIGGTTLRIGHVHGACAEVRDVRRVPTDGLDRHPRAPAAELQQLVLDQLVRQLDAYRNDDGGRARAIGLSFAGPMTVDGIATAAPTIWGPGGAPLRVGDVLERSLGVPVLVANDITAAAWRYAASEPEPFCLFTISSGIGNKVFRHGEVVIDDAGYGGELGHWRVDPSPDAPWCDCGGQGHLGAIASGRGVLAAARRAALVAPRKFARSALAEEADGHPSAITNEALASAIRAGDQFAVDVLRSGLVSLASAVGCVFAAIGVRRHLFIGGFAVAVGERFIEVLGDELVRLGCFGLRPAQVRRMLAMGAADDDHSLIGIGQMLAHQLAHATEGDGTDAYADHR